ncbi:amidohydrolase family protein [Curtobacterium flaccumfaciens]|nr:amidohydrolase family protein [Curtobacterium flaccumfaciens pv. flaccumfaciens]
MCSSPGSSRRTCTSTRPCSTGNARTPTAPSPAPSPSRGSSSAASPTPPSATAPAPCSTRPSRTAPRSSAHTPTSTRSSGSPASRCCSTCATSTGTPSTCRSSRSPRRASPRHRAPSRLRQALAAGADVIGGCTYNEHTLAACHEHVETVLDLAEEFGVPADLHADFADDTSDPRYALAGHIADRVTARGLQGRVALGHVTSVASLPRDERRVLFDRLAAAGVAVVPLPATDLHLGGRSDDHDVRRGVVPVRELWDAGVTSAYASNNVRNAFTPFGNADLLDVGLLLAQTGHLSGPDDLRRVLAMATTGAAEVVGVADTHGIRPGAAADLVVLSTTDPDGVLLDRPDRALVVKRGRVVAETTRTTRLTTSRTTNRSKELSHA